MTKTEFSPTLAGAPAGGSEAIAMEAGLRPLWWVWLLTAAAWLFGSLVILQFDQASVTTVGVVIGCMFVITGAQNVFLGMIAERVRWLYIAMGVIFLAVGVACFFQPVKTFAGVADILGFLLMLVGVWWAVEALVLRAEHPLWWVKLLAGLAMNVLAFWTAGQFFIDKAYLLLVIAGIWALLNGLGDIARAFALRSLTR